MEKDKSKGVNLRIEGDFYYWHSLAHVNRELAIALHKLGWNVSISPRSPVDPKVAKRFPHYKLLSKMESQTSDILLTVRHGFPPDLSSIKQPTVIMQPWEFQAVPDEWVARFSAFTEVWVNSHFTKNAYVNSGLDPRKIRVMPLGVDTVTFSPNDGPASHSEGASFRFLYVGGTIERKGIGVLLQAFLNEFGDDPQVELVIKDSGTAHVYSHNHQGRFISELIAGGANIRYIDEDLEPKRLADLYRSCNCLVQPYRAEGFCLPVLEAMACGLPVIVTAGGPTDDFVLQHAGWRIASTTVEIPQMPGHESSRRQGWLQPSLDDLTATMREAFEQGDKTADKGRRASEIVRSAWSWQDVGKEYAGRIQDLTRMRMSLGDEIKQRPKLSLCMIVRDEERVLEDCLQSAEPFFDEIIIVDTGSTDRTKEIALKYTDMVFDFQWVESFAAARNESLKHASGDWIFWMDADDTLPVESGLELRRVAAQAEASIVGFVVPVQFVDEGLGSGTRVDHVKFFRNLPGLQFEGRIHEQILSSLCSNGGGTIARCNAVVLHSGYDTSEKGQQKKRERDFRLLELEYQERPDHPFVLFNLGMTHFYTGDTAAAIKWLTMCLDRSQQQESHRRKAIVLLSLAYEKQGNREEAIRTLETASREYPDDAEIPFQLALLLRSIGDLNGARTNYQRVLDKKLGTYLSSLDIGIFGFKTFHNLGAIEFELGNYSDAIEWYERALKDSPEHTISAEEMLSAAIASFDWDRAKTAMEHVRHLLGECQLFTDMFAKYQVARVGKERANAILGERVDASGSATPWILSYVRGLLDINQVQAALPLLKELDRRGIAEAAYLLGVHETQIGNLPEALRWMEKANKLNPGHQQTVQQISNLKAAIADQ